MSDTVLVSASEGVATITLNRPDALNSFTTELKDALLETFLQVAADPAARATARACQPRGPNHRVSPATPRPERHRRAVARPPAQGGRSSSPPNRGQAGDRAFRLAVVRWRVKLPAWRWSGGG